MGWSVGRGLIVIRGPSRDYLRRPTVALISSDDEMPSASPAAARVTFEAVAGPCEIVDIEAGHFGLLFYRSPEFEAAAAAQAAFLMAHLQAEG